VIARVRPLTKAEESRQEQPKVSAEPSSNCICVFEKATNKTIRVPFDKAFGAAAEQGAKNRDFNSFEIGLTHPPRRRCLQGVVPSRQLHSRWI
jgi:hypothetical protein